MEELYLKIKFITTIRSASNSQEFISLYIKTISKDFNNYPNIITLLPTITETHIRKLDNSIQLHFNEDKSLDKLLSFYDDLCKTNYFDLLKYILIHNYKYTNEDILLVYNTKYSNNNFIWRNNQRVAYEKAINSDYINGIHSQATGSGKSLIALKICGEYNKDYQKHNIIWICERKDIPEKLFFNYNRITNKLEIKDDKVEFWKNNDIINLNNFNVIEMINNKPVNYHNIINNMKVDSKPYFWIINRAFLTTKRNSKSNKYKYQDITNEPNLCIIDECHSSQSNETYKLLLYMKHKWNTKIQGFSATPYRSGKSTVKNIEDLNLNISESKKDKINNKQNIKKLIEIFHKVDDENQLNIISWFNMKEAIESGVILEPIFHWFQMVEEEEDKEYISSESYLQNIKPICYYKKKENEKTKDIKNKEKEINSTFKVLDDIISNCYYKKIICWCKKIDNSNEWHDNFKKYKHQYENLKNIKEYIDHSQIKSDDYNDFYSSSTGILFCAVKHREGSDIPYLTVEMFLDKVKNRGALPLIQHIGRVLRIDEENGYKTYGHIVDGLIITKKCNEDVKMKELLDKILKYYIDLYNICNIYEDDNDNDYKNTNIVSNTKQKQYREIMDNLIIDHTTKKIVFKLKNNKQIVIDINHIELKEITWKHLTKRFNIFLKDKIKFDSYHRNLTSSVIQNCNIKNSNGKMITNKKRYRTILIDIWKTIDREYILSKTTCNIKETNESGTKGFDWIECLGFSFQGADANNTFKEILNMIKLKKYTLDIEIKLKNTRIININYP